MVIKAHIALVRVLSDFVVQSPAPMTEKVKVTALGPVCEISVVDWPNGAFLGDAIHTYSGQQEESSLFPKDSNGSAVPIDPSTYWQTCSRWALLYKFGGTDQHPGYLITATTTNKRHILQVNNTDVVRIRREWQAILDQPSSSNATPELKDFLSTSTSNGKELQWSILQCAPGCQFRLHAHPNLELVYCVNGALFEIRRKIHGGWAFDTLNAGQWLVNETDSVHKSFTATNGEGCTLLVLWSGSHANLDELEHVQKAVNDADRKLDGCQNCLDWNEIKETFLPASEKATAKDLQNA